MNAWRMAAQSSTKRGGAAWVGSGLALGVVVGVALGVAVGLGVGLRARGLGMVPAASRSEAVLEVQRSLPMARRNAW